jgi:hypothetical protein
LGLQFETNPPSELPYAAVQRSKGFWHVWMSYM